MPAESMPGGPTQIPIESEDVFTKLRTKTLVTTTRKGIKMTRHYLVSVILLIVSSGNEAHQEAAHLRQRKVLNQRELEHGTRIFAKYRGQRGHEVALECARTVIKDNDDDDVIILQGNGFCMEQLRRDTDVVEAGYDYQVHALGTTSDDYTRKLSEIIPYGLKMIQADQLEAGDNDVTVCIVDSGIALAHPDFDSSRISGEDTVRFYGPRWEWNKDKVGHGTHIAGTIAAMGGNGQGVRGAGSFKLHVVRGLDDDGVGYESDIRNAVQKCVDAGAKIINLSLGSDYMTPQSERFYTDVVENQGVMIIAAAGNNGNERMIYPASHPSVMSVGAVYEWGTHLTGSNQNNQVEFAAAGHNILSTTASTSSVQLEDFGYPAVHISGSADSVATGDLVLCEENNNKCTNAKNGGICLMVRDGATSIQDLLESCENSGGAGAVIFDANSDDSIEDWSVEEASFPAVAVKQEYGTGLLLKLGDTVTIGDSGDDSVEYTYATLNGTSMATAHVSAAAALLWSHYEGCSNHQIRYALASTAINPGGSSCDDSYGYGIVKVKDAFDWLAVNSCDSWDVPRVSQGGCTTL
jgi:serine protease